MDSIKRVLLVNNEKDDDIDLLKSILSQLSFGYIEASSYQEAMEHLGKSVFEMVLIDINNEELNGFRISEIVKENVSDYIPTIAIVTKDKLKSLNDKLQTFTFDDFFRKPFSENVLKLRFSSYMKLKVYHDALYNSKNKLEEELENYKNFSLEVLKAISMGIILYNRKGRIVFENEASKEIIGECINSSINDLFLSKRFLTGKTADFDFLDDRFEDSLYLVTTEGRYIEVKKMGMIKGSRLNFGAVVINELNPEKFSQKADHKSLKSFLKSF